MIDDILTSNNFVLTTHESCLYSATIDGHTVFFLRQVDDFAVSAPTKEITNKVFAMIQAKLHEPLKILGKLELYNGLDITQGRNFIKVSFKSNITKFLQSHNCMEPPNKLTKPPIK